MTTQITPQKHIFFDLEDTLITPVIEGWLMCELVNFHKIQSILNEFQPTHVHTFTFAIHDDNDRCGFEAHCKQWIEQTHQFTFSTCNGIHEIRERCCRVKGLQSNLTSISDMVEFWGKQVSFRLFAEDWFKQSFSKHNPNQPVEIMLVDDSIIPEKFELFDGMLKASCVLPF
jgi:hypothetical protein